ncbi:MAG TPA: SusC/RagA family TonB-linked outer membrane protein, partial [Chryseosolibacter sp.]
DYVDAEGVIRQNYWNVGSNGGANPYWTVNRNLKEDISDRIIALASLTYQLAPGLSIMGRSAIDRSFGLNDTRLYTDTYIIAQNGRYSQRRSDAMEWNSDFLISYQRTLNDNWSFNINAGGNARKQRSSSLTAETGANFIAPNFFALGNTQLPVVTHYVAPPDVGGPKDVNSLYAFGQLAFKNAIFLDLTARNDWSSTLPKDNWSYFYPSVGLNFVLSDLMAFPQFFSFAKVRGSYAEVGNDTSPFQLQRTSALTAGGRNGFITLSGTLPNEDLKPEATKSIEVGADLRFFLNRLGVDFTWYKTNSTDQLFTVALPIGSGATSFFTNGGDVQNTGVEVVLSGRPVTVGDFNWDITLNFARNVSLVKKINDERPSVEVGADFLRRFRIEEGRPFGEVYSRGLLRDDQGRVLVEDNGLPRVTPGFTVRVANYNPDWLGGIQNAFTYRNFRFSFLIDIRHGGSISSLGNAIIYADGLTEETLEGREGGLIFGENFFENETAIKGDGSPNDIPIDAEQFWLKVGGRNAPVGEIFAVDASNIRFREAVLGYSLPSAMLDGSPFRRVSLSFVARNLFFFSNKAENIDPDVTVGTAANGAGYDAFGPPTARSYGFNLNLGF